MKDNTETMFYKNGRQVMEDEFTLVFHTFLLFKDGDAVGNLRRLCEIMHMAIYSKSNSRNEFNPLYINGDYIEIFAAKPKYPGNIKDKEIIFRYNVKTKNSELRLIQYILDGPPIEYSRVRIVNNDAGKDIMYCTAFITDLECYLENKYFINLSKNYYIDKYKEEIE